MWNQDDCVAVKDGSSDMLFERVTASGVGLTIGSIGASEVRNITFKDCNMYDTYKVSTRPPPPATLSTMPPLAAANNKALENPADARANPTHWNIMWGDEIVEDITGTMVRLGVRETMLVWLDAAPA